MANAASDGVCLLSKTDSRMLIACWSWGACRYFASRAEFAHSVGSMMSNLGGLDSKNHVLRIVIEKCDVQTGHRGMATAT
jgi:hypothetical protein